MITLAPFPLLPFSGARGRVWSRLAAALVAALLCASTGCQSAPDWITQPPVDAVYLYGIGYYTGALNPSDNYLKAVDQAKANLAGQVKSTVSVDSWYKYFDMDGVGERRARHTRRRNSRTWNSSISGPTSMV